MAAPLDWAAFSEADEESRQALLKRAVKIEPSLGVVLQSTAKKVCTRALFVLEIALLEAYWTKQIEHRPRAPPFGRCRWFGFMSACLLHVS